MGVVRFVKVQGVGVDVGVFGMLKKARSQGLVVVKQKLLLFFPCLEVG